MIRCEGGALTNGTSARMRMHAQSLQLFLILCDSMSCIPPGSSFHGMKGIKAGEVISLRKLVVLGHFKVLSIIDLYGKLL